MTSENDLSFDEEPSVETLTSSSFNIYTGPWSKNEVNHLLNRCTFGANPDQMEEVLQIGLEATIERLFEETDLPNPPLNYDNQEDPNVPIGETWIDEFYTPGVFLWGYRSRSLRAWTIDNILNEGISIREKLALFWQNHFAVSKIVDANFLYLYINQLRTNAWGNFKQLIKEITIDPSMLIFLDGHTNTRLAPNENYARELLELYTIGKGPQVAPGDYTTFTEQDVGEIARVLTGWKDQGFLSSDEPVSPFFYEYDHDYESKQLSHRFNNTLIPNLLDQEYLHLIDIIFEQDEVAYFISRKLYKWFVSPKISAAVEIEIIEPMAQLILENDFEIKPALKALLSSEHFFELHNRGHFIKNPLDFILSPLKKFEVSLPEDLTMRYTVLLKLYSLSQQLDQDYYNPPEVAGWPSYRQSPLYHRVWINSNSLRYREEYSSIITQNGYPFEAYELKLNVLEIIDQLDNPFDPNQLIIELEELLLSHPLNHYQRLELKHILIPGLPDFEWTEEYSYYLENSNDPSISAALESKLRLFFRYFFRLPEYYLT